ncbi:F-box protein [Rosa sericea]
MEPSEEKKKKKKKTKTLFEVPHPLEQADILINILSRVPTKKMFQFRCVSPFWHRVLTQPRFTICLKSNRFILMDNASAIDPNADRWSGLLCIEIDTYNPTSPSDIVFRLPFDLPTRAAEISGSCNGLLCLFGRFTDELFYVFNPLTGEYVCLPQPSKRLPNVFFYGFGCASASKVYKIVIAIPQPNQELEVLVHTIGTDEWRNVATASMLLPTLEEGDGCFGTYENGTIYWLGSNGVLWGFDVEGETDRVLGLPTLADIIKEGDVDCIVNLGLLKQSLCLIVGIRGSDSRVNVFLKKNNVVNEINQFLWKHKFVMHAAVIDNATVPLLVSKKRQMLMFHKGRLAAFTHGRKGLTKIVLANMKTSANAAFVHYPSFASLADDIYGLNPSVVKITKKLEYPARSM